jgi:uncharacterized protein YciI
VKSILFALVGFALAACQSLPAGTPGSSSLDCVFLQLKTGPRSTGVGKEESQKAFAGHFANMERLAGERRLLVAGPYGAPKRDPDLRGVFVLDVAHEDEAQALAGTDPCVVAGILRPGSVRMRTWAPLRAYIEHELVPKAERDARGEKVSPADTIRPYVIPTAEDGRRARHALVDLPGVVLWGDLADGRGLAILDAQDAAACETLLGDRAPKVGRYVLDPWYASRELVKLAQFARSGA